MKRILKAIALMTVAASVTGCASPRAYLTDRGRDLADIVAIGAGMGGGAKVRVGPIQTGLFADVQMAALRGGQFPCGNDAYILPSNFDLEALFTGVESFDPKFGRSTAKQRRKSFTAEGHNIPFIMIVDHPGSPSYYTQIEVAGGLLLNVRLGFNPVELLDFLLGWVAVDIFDDDIEIRKANESNQSPHVPAHKLAEPER
ncbi:MAG: hypothetical protein H3C50_00545 [Kiritimatiellae bacterium]|nr:hypothetical protein [Kiritimatiellia bacterium]MCO5062412.1 hypothetical protein [Kiritimatiellia bacterium]